MLSTSQIRWITLAVILTSLLIVGLVIAIVFGLPATAAGSSSLGADGFEPESLELSKSEKKRKWIQKQVEFCYGSWWKQSSPREGLPAHEMWYKGEEVRTGNYLDGSRLCPGLCHERNIHAIKEMFAHDPTRHLKDETVFPIHMGDAIRSDGTKFRITFTRPPDAPHSLIWPLYGHYNATGSGPDSTSNWSKFSDRWLWEEKQPRLIWRGTLTGITNGEPLQAQRWTFVKKWYHAGVAGRSDMDVAFKVELESYYRTEPGKSIRGYTRQHMSMDQQLNSRYILCLEGNDAASGFPWAMLSNSCVLHSWPFHWLTYQFGQGPEPWVHFVPVNPDGSDLGTVFDWCLRNQESCRVIAQNGREYMLPYSDPELENETLREIVTYYPDINVG